MKTLTDQEQLLKAIRVATRAHAGQKRKDGTDYIMHPIRCMVRASLAGESVVIQTILVLHDTIEDTALTLEELVELGFGKEVVDGVDGMTKRNGEDYLEDFIPRCAKNPNSNRGKNYDIDDNMEDQSALDKSEAEFLSARYTEARKILNG